ncbi:MAG: serine/threonine protein kinase [Planctomycetes bacterium]|nr:serine/threonine protein kinase [Planctomycetota bacterium]
MADPSTSPCSKEDLAFGQAAMKQRLVTTEQINECLEIQSKVQELGVSKRLSEILVEKGHLTKEQAGSIQRSIAPEAGSGATQIPGYQLLSKLGQGAMGAVYKAKQLSMDRVVAVKLLPPRLGRDRTFVTRFVREARAVAKLNHENIIVGIDVGEASGLHYFVMEYVDGETVAQALKREKRLDEKRALGIILQIARALDHAHTHSLVHRDVKPENMMVTKDGVAKLCDLGLAKETTSDSSLTQSGTSVGTPFYISPEQARGEPNIDIRSDLYSLGASLYHLLTGGVPFNGSTAAVVMTKHVTEALVPPRKVRPDITATTDAFVCRLMSKRREGRYQTPAEVIDDLTLMLTGKPPRHLALAAEPVESEPAITAVAAHPAPAAPARRSIGMMAGVVGAVLLLALVGMALSRSGKPAGNGNGGGNGGGIVGPTTSTTSTTSSPEPPPPPPTPILDPKTGDVGRDSLASLDAVAQKNWENINRFEEILQKYDGLVSKYGDTPAGKDILDSQEKFQRHVEESGDEALHRTRGLADPFEKQGDLVKAIEVYEAFPPALQKTKAAATARQTADALKGRLSARLKDDEGRIEKAVGQKDFDLALRILDGLLKTAPPSMQKGYAERRRQVEQAREEEMATRRKAASEAYAKLGESLKSLGSARDWTGMQEAVDRAISDPAMESVRDRLALDREDVGRLLTADNDLTRGIEGCLGEVIELSKQKGQQVRLVKEGGRVVVELPQMNNARVGFDRKGLGWSDVRFFIGKVEDLKSVEARMNLGVYAYFAGLEKEAVPELEAARDGGIARATYYLDLLGGGSAVSPGAHDPQGIFEEAEAAYLRADFAAARDAYERLLKDFPDAAVVKANRGKIEEMIGKCRARLSAGPGPGPGPGTPGTIEELFRGKVRREGNRVSITYDFTSADQQQDWESQPINLKFLADRGMDAQKNCDGKGMLDIGGTARFVWKGKLAGDCLFEMRAVAKDDKNLGMTFCGEGDGRMYLGVLGIGGDNRALTRIVAAPNALLRIDTTQGKGPESLRVLGSKSEPRLVSGQTYGPLRLERQGPVVRFIAGEVKVAEAENSELTRGGLSIWLVNSRALVDEIRIVGTLDSEWVREATERRR